MHKHYFKINNGGFQFNQISSILRVIRKAQDKKKHWGAGYQKGFFNKYKKDQFLYKTGITHQSVKVVPDFNGMPWSQEKQTWIIKELNKTRMYSDLCL